MIKFLDLVSQYHSIKHEIDMVITNTLETGTFIGGEKVAEFEANFADYQNAKYCVGVGNGTDAIEIALEALKMPTGGEVIVPANSFIASSEAISRSGLKVVFADVNSEDYTLDPIDVERRINKNTVAIIAVHLYGHPCKMDELLELSRAYNLRLIEDCAQAHGAKYRQRRLGAQGDIGAFSFYPGKNLGAYGDGGAIVTNDRDLAIRCRMIANHGRIAKYNHEFEGRNSRLDALQAGILGVKLAHLDGWIEQRNKIADIYMSELKDCKGVILPMRFGEITHAFHLFVLRCEQRDALASFLSRQGIETVIHYPIALPKLGAYSEHFQANEDFEACKFSGQLLSLPIGEHIGPVQARQVTSAVKNFFADYNN
jgi:dTDP-4-amino-4,6-dideoxygalactose transaminase